MMDRKLAVALLAGLAVMTSTLLPVPLHGQECCSDFTSRLDAALSGKCKETPEQVLADYGWRNCCANSPERERHLVDMVLDKWRDAKEIAYDERQVLNLLPFALSGERGAQLLLDGMINRGMWNAWAASDSPSFDDLPANARQHYIEVMLSAISSGKISQTYLPDAKASMSAVIAAYPSKGGLKALAGFFRERPEKSLIAIDLFVTTYKLGKRLSGADMKLILEMYGSNRVFDLWFLSGAEMLMDKDDAKRLKCFQEKARREHPDKRIIPMQDYIRLGFTAIRQETKG